MWAISSVAMVLAMINVLALPAAAKTPGGVHCYGKTCHRVSTLEEMDGIVGRTGVLKASFYDDCRVDRFNACGLTSSGALFRPDLTDNAASPIFPDGTVLLVYNAITRKAAVVRVNSAGPYWGDRKLDVSRATAEKLGFRDKGVADLLVAIIKSPEEHEARYKKRRQYAPVPGFIGTFPSFHAAHAAALEALALVSKARPAVLAQAMAEASAMPEDLKRVPATRPSRPPPPRPGRAELFAHAISYVEAVRPDIVTVAPVRIPEGLRPPAAAAAAAAYPAVLAPPLPVAAARYTPAATLAAYEPDGSLEGWRQWLSAFAASARHRARAHERPPALPPPDLWSEKLVRFVWRARQQARETVSRSGPLYKLMAELKLKAQPPRRFAR